MKTTPKVSQPSAHKSRISTSCSSQDNFLNFSLDQSLFIYQPNLHLPTRYRHLGNSPKPDPEPNPVFLTPLRSTPKTPVTENKKTNRKGEKFLSKMTTQAKASTCCGKSAECVCGKSEVLIPYRFHRSWIAQSLPFCFL